MSIDDLDPHPVFEVMVSGVQVYGVDPTWLVCGEYDSTRHRQALEDDAAIARVLAEFVARPVERPRSTPSLPIGLDAPNPSNE